MSDVDNGAGYAGMGSGDMGNLCTFSQFLCTLKTSLKKNKSHTFKKKKERTISFIKINLTIGSIGMSNVENIIPRDLVPKLQHL